MNKTGTFKVSAISKAQTAQKTFSEKNLKFLIFFFQKMSHSAEKCKRGDPLGYIKIYSVANYQKTRKENSFQTLKNFRKKSHNAEENRPFSLVRFCRLR